MLLAALQDETYCLKTQVHPWVCTGTNHVCYRCGMFLGTCNCPRLGTLLDYCAALEAHDDARGRTSLRHACESLYQTPEPAFGVEVDPDFVARGQLGDDDFSPHLDQL